MFNDDNDILKMLFMALTVLMFFQFIIFPILNIETRTINNDVELYQAHIPDGTTWTRLYGNFVLGSGHVDSDLMVSYVLKYFEGKELKTVILDATASNVHIFEGKGNMTMIIEQQSSIFSNGWQNKHIEYMIYVPLNGTVS